MRDVSSPEVRGELAWDRVIETRSEVLETSVIPDRPMWGTRQELNLRRLDS